jgi:hypothetical protein
VPEAVDPLALEAPPQPQVLEVRQRLGQRQPILVGHQVAPEEVAGHDHRRGGSPAHEDLDAAAQAAAVMGLDGPRPVGPFVERPAVPGEQEGRVQLCDAVERVEELTERVLRLELVADVRGDPPEHGVTDEDEANVGTVEDDVAVLVPRRPVHIPGAVGERHLVAGLDLDDALGDRQRHPPGPEARRWRGRRLVPVLLVAVHELDVALGVPHRLEHPVRDGMADDLGPRGLLEPSCAAEVVGVGVGEVDALDVGDLPPDEGDPLFDALHGLRHRDGRVHEDDPASGPAGDVDVDVVEAREGRRTRHPHDAGAGHRDERTFLMGPPRRRIRAHSWIRSFTTKVTLIHTR